jgi:long-subunit fatty acid transport protein
MPAGRIAPSLLLAAALAPLPALAGSISAPGYLGGPDSGAATPNPAAAHYNPAALGGTARFEYMVDTQFAFIRVDHTATRNGGIDPNTGEAYDVAQARVQVPVAILGASYQVIPNKLTFGLAVTDAFVGGGDYRSGEPDQEEPYVTPGRYSGVMTKVVTLHVVPAMAVTPAKGVHLGGGVKIIMDSIEAIQAADPLGTEGVDPGNPDEPYAADSYLLGEASGTHLGWNAGLYVDRWKKARFGLSYHDNGDFSAEGEGAVHAPEVIGGGDPDANISFDFPLPQVLFFWLNSDLTNKLTVGGGVEYQMWNSCCGGEDGDIVIGLTSKDGDAIGEDSEEDGVTLIIDETQYSPRRLWNSANYGLNAGYKVNDKLWLGGRTGYNQNAVPDYAVSPTNLDFANVGFMVAGRYKVAKKVVVGLSYAKFFTFERDITDSAWNLQDGNTRFSPEYPFKASTNGNYKSKVDVVGVRIASAF